MDEIAPKSDELAAELARWDGSRHYRRRGHALACLIAVQGVTVAATRRRAPTSAPVSTKIVVGLGLLLVVGGFALAGWQSLTSDDPAEAIAAAPHPAQQYLPSVETVVAYAAAIGTVVIAGAYVLVRSRRRRSGF
jgi:hypothetical protein